MNKHELMKQHLLNASKHEYSIELKTYDQLVPIEPKQIEISLDQQIERIQQNPILTAFIKSEWPKRSNERLTYNQFCQLQGQL